MYLNIIPNVDGKTANFFYGFRYDPIKYQNAMLTTAKSAIHLSAIALGIIVVNLSTLPSNAQSMTADSFNFDEIDAGGKGNWNFSSEDETASIRDNLKELGEYDISGGENFDIKLIQRNRRRWGNRGDRPDYSLENRIFPDYPLENRIYNYY